VTPPNHAAASGPTPVIGVCGHSGSGKTTLLEQLVPLLKACGLSVAAVKHDAHGLDVDRPGKDSDRLFRAGADVLVHDPRQGLVRFHALNLSLPQAVERLGGAYDVVLVEGHKGSPGPKIWLLGDGESAPPDGVSGVLAVLPRHADRAARACELVVALLGRTGSSLPGRKESPQERGGSNGRDP
jgi:molybdopterin-guanine dinucleotide biosynthesis protein MobB